LIKTHTYLLKESRVIGAIGISAPAITKRPDSRGFQMSNMHGRTEEVFGKSYVKGHHVSHGASCRPQNGCGRFERGVITSAMIAINTPLILPEVMSKVAGMGPAALQAVHRFINLMELNSLVEDIKDEAEGLRIAGKLEPEILDAAIREHRLKHG
jgi:hypothetical protein